MSPARRCEGVSSVNPSTSNMGDGTSSCRGRATRFRMWLDITVKLRKPMYFLKIVAECRCFYVWLLWAMLLEAPYSQNHPGPFPALIPLQHIIQEPYKFVGCFFFCFSVCRVDQYWLWCFGKLHRPSHHNPLGHRHRVHKHRGQCGSSKRSQLLERILRTDDHPSL